MARKITISEVLELLNQGKTRPEIAEHFEISASDCTKLFKHPKLKGKRAIKQPDFLIIDDTETTEEDKSTSNVEESPVVEEVKKEEDTTKGTAFGEGTAPGEVVKDKDSKPVDWDESDVDDVTPEPKVEPAKDLGFSPDWGV